MLGCWCGDARRLFMTPIDAVGVLTKLVKNPYLDTYEKMPENELTAWRDVFERSVALKPTREKALRLRAIKRTLRTNTKQSRAA
jgi:hypothetical protein